MDAAILAALIVLNGVFALSEIALVSARGALLKAQAADPGGRRAARKGRSDGVSLVAARRAHPNPGAEGSAAARDCPRAGALPHLVRDDHGAARQAAADRRLGRVGRLALRIVDMDGKRVDKVLAKRVAPPPNQPNAG